MEFNKKEILNDLPSELRKIVNEGIWEKDTMGMSDSKVYRIRNTGLGGNGYLKIMHHSSSESLSYERNIYNWLENRLPVPKVIYYSKDDTKEILFISEIEGRNGADEKLGLLPEYIAKLMARGLKTVHSLDIKDCPYISTLDNKLAIAHERIVNGEVDEEDFEESYRGKKAEEIYDILIKTKPKDEDLVFTHGDYCLPNIMISNKEISGFIDMGRAGLADKYQDIALALRTLRHNFNDEKLEEIFLSTYGIEEVNLEKVKYYILLDELF